MVLSATDLVDARDGGCGLDVVRDHGAAGEREERLGQVERERPEARPLLRPRDQDHRLHRRHLHLDSHKTTFT